MDANDSSGGQPPGWAPPPDPGQPPAPASWPQQPTWPQPGWPQQPGSWGAAPPAWAPPPKQKRFGWLAISLAFLVGGFISFVVTIGGVVAIGLALGTPDVIAGTHPAPKEGADIVRVGDCLRSEPGVAAVVDRSDVTSCDEAHDAEVAGVIEIPDAKRLPGNDDLQMYVDDACLLAFEGYIDVDYDDSMYDYVADVPSKEAWADGDRTAFCLVDTTGSVAGDGSLRGSGD